jgi:N-acetylmuramic acid 6-phosphate etherase
MSALEIVRLMTEEEAVVLEAVANADVAIAQAAQQAARAFQAGGRILYVGAGTSGRMATMDAAEMPPTFGIDPGRFLAVIAGGAAAGTQARENAEDDEIAAIEVLNDLRITLDDIVIGIAASGTTPFVVSAVRHAREKGIWTCGIANNRNTPLLQAAEHPILLDTGPEVLTGSTRLKAGTSQKLVLNRISTAAMVLSGKVIENLMVDVKAANAKLRDRCARILCELAPVTMSEAQALLEANNWSIRDALAAVGQPA